MMQPEQVADAIAVACKAASAGRFNRGLITGAVVGAVVTLAIASANKPRETQSQTANHSPDTYAVAPHGVRRYGYYQ